MLYDTHCHPYLQKDKNKSDTIESFKKEFPEGFLNSIGTNLETSNKAIEETKKYDFVKATIGIHPCDIYDLDLNTSIDKLEDMYLKNKKNIVAIGECGLDYYHLPAKTKVNLDEKGIKKLQKDFFKSQIELAKKYDLPVIIHNRESANDVFKIIKETGLRKFVLHCYSEDLEYAQKIIDYAPEAMISFSGIVTFNSAKEIQNTAKNIALKNILVETDAPYLTPAPHRGKQENEPIFTKHVLEKIIELRNEEDIIIKKQIFENSLKTFIEGKKEL